MKRQITNEGGGLDATSAGAGVGQRDRAAEGQAGEEAAGRVAEERFRVLFESSRDAIMTLEPPAWRFTSGNPATVSMFKAANEEDFTTREPWTLSPERQPDGRDSAEKAREMIDTALREGSHFFEWMHTRIGGEAFPATVLLTRMEVGGRAILQASVRDITERKRREAYRDMGQEILRILNEAGERQDYIQRVIASVKARTGFDAVGIRLQEGLDFPYFAQDGLSTEFLRTENTLLARAADGGVCRDKDGNVSLECTCGLVISGKIPPGHPFFTPAGSFWTNDSFPLLDLPADQDPRLQPRNNCIHQGHASVALVPIRNRDRIVGLLHINDRRKGCFTLETIELMEGVAANIGSALMRKQAEEELRESEERFHSLAKSMGEGVWFASVDGRDFLYVNPALERLYGYCSADFRENPDLWKQASHPDDRDKLEASTRTLVEQGRAELEYRIIRRDGEVRWVFDRKALIKDPLGKPICIGGIISDITERKRAKQELEVSETRFRTIFENAPAMIDGFDGNGRCILWNAECEKTFGWTMAEINSHADPLSLFYPDPEIRRQVVETVTAKPDGVLREWHPRTKDGTVQTCLWANFSLPDGTVMNLGYDITERKRAEEEKERLLARLAQAGKMESIGGLARGMAHAINNPITGVMNYAQLIKDEAAGNAPFAGFADEIIAESKRIATMTHSLLSYTEQGNPQNVSPITPAELVFSVLPEAMEAARKCGIDLSGGISPDLPAVSCRKGRMGDVLKALLTNALEALNKKYPGAHEDKVIRVTARIEVRGQKTEVRGQKTEVRGQKTEVRGQKTEVPPSPERYGGQAGVQGSGPEGEKAGGVGDVDAGSLEAASQRWVRITVEDHGAGILPEFRERVFDPFFTTKDRTEHSGLGLWISRSTVEEQGGKLSVESEAGQWTRVHVDLPV